MAEPETPRFYSWLSWAHSIGCRDTELGLCAIRIAICAVEQEFGRKADLARRCEHFPRCDDVAAKHWAERPKKVVDF